MSSWGLPGILPLQVDCPIRNKNKINWLLVEGVMTRLDSVLVQWLTCNILYIQGLLLGLLVALRHFVYAERRIARNFAGSGWLSNYDSKVVISRPARWSFSSALIIFPTFRKQRNIVQLWLWQQSCLIMDPKWHNWRGATFLFRRTEGSHFNIIAKGGGDWCL